MIFADCNIVGDGEAAAAALAVAAGRAVPKYGDDHEFSDPTIA